MPIPKGLDLTQGLLLGAVVLLTGALVWLVVRRRLRLRPVRLLLGRLATEPSTMDLFLRGMFVPGNEFFSRSPEYPAGTTGIDTVYKWTNIPEVHTAGDLRAAGEILRLLVAVNSRLGLAFRSGEAGPAGWTADAMAIGPHHRALQILDTCEPRLVAFRNPDAFRSLVSPEVFAAKPGVEYGLIYKGRHPVSRRIFWVVMGLSDLGTEAAAGFLRVKAAQLGRFTGSAPFAAIIQVGPAQAPATGELRWLQPRVRWWRRFLFRNQWRELFPERRTKAG